MTRINEVMREVIGDAAAKLEDPRIGFMTVTAVQTSPDLRSAKVLITVLGDEEQRAATLAGLAAAHGVLQQAVAREVRLKWTPTLSFAYDESLERAARLTQLLEGDGEAPAPGPAAGEEGEQS